MTLMLFSVPEHDILNFPRHGQILGTLVKNRGPLT